jgi:hypothetical protein
LRKLSSICISFERVDFRFPAFPAERVERGLEQVGIVDARDLDRVLEGEEHAPACALLRLEREQVLAEPGRAALGDVVAGASGQHVRERALARAVRSHDRVHLAGLHLEVQALEDLAGADLGVEVADAEHVCTSLESVSRRSLPG